MATGDVTLQHNQVRLIEVSIASGANLSSGVDLYGYTPVGVLVPSAWISAVMTFQASPSGTTYGNVFEDTTELQESVVSSQFHILDPATFVGAPWIKLRSGTSAAAVNQTNGAVCYLVTKLR